MKMPCAALAALLLCVTPVTHGQEAPVAIDIPAQPLPDALRQLGKQTPLQLFFTPDLVAGKSAPEVRGQMVPRQALDSLLKGSGIEAVQSGSGVALRRAVALQTEQQLAEVRVQAAAARETATGPVTGYSARRSATATKTDTPIILTPASIQVVPREVIDDQKALNLKDVYENVSGVQQSGNTLNAQSEVLPYIRGFESPALMRNGLRATIAGVVDLVNVERVEVLKGPASILYGALEPGGIVNYVTKRPLSESSHSLEQQIGRWNHWRTSVDSTGPLNPDRSLLYRFNASYTNSDSFRDFVELERTAIAPSLLWRSGRTELLLDFSYVKERQPYDAGVPVDANGRPRAARNAFFNDPKLAGRENEDTYVGYQLTHALSPTWTLRNQFQIHEAHNRNETLRPRGIAGNAVQMRYQNEDRTDDEWQFVLDATAKFSTGPIAHTLITGLEVIEQKMDFLRFRVNTPNIPISDHPIVSFTPPADQTAGTTLDVSDTRWKSLYVQDQLSFLQGGRLKVLLGGRFDDVETTAGGTGLPDTTIRDRAFTGRGGVLYMLTPQHSVYASASQSFRPQLSSTVASNGRPLDPERGRQYEIGLKSTFFDELLLATLAIYDIEKKNVAVFDQALFNATGQSAFFPGVRQRSRGYEIDVAGNLTRDLKVIASYSYTDTEVLENRGAPAQVGLPIGGIAPHAARLWLSYNVTGRKFQGLGFGGGVRYVGESTAQADPTLQLESYTVWDFGVWYAWKNMKASVTVKNLFDESYIARASFNAIAHYGAPRHAIAALSIGF